MGTELPDGMPAINGDSQRSSELCRAQYSAEQIPGEVRIRAIGLHRNGGFKTYFKKSLIAIYPPEFVFLHEAPNGPSTMELAPFCEEASFQADEVVKSVTVHDADGKHSVPVEQVLDKLNVSVLESSGCKAHGWIRT